MKMKKKKKKLNEPLSEQETRIKIFADCRKHYGLAAERQLRLIFDKWDTVLSKCTNLQERKAITTMAAAEVYQIMGYSGGLSVGGQIIIPDDK